MGEIGRKKREREEKKSGGKIGREKSKRERERERLIDVAFITLRNNLVALLETLYTGISFFRFAEIGFFPSINIYKKGS